MMSLQLPIVFFFLKLTILEIIYLEICKQKFLFSYSTLYSVIKYTHNLIQTRKNLNSINEVSGLHLSLLLSLDLMYEIKENKNVI